ncbi:MAG: sodium-dependent bicarbonate transport family permease [Nitrospirota bacterium]|nr:sodium-dependent bicarbonate transport family permease [Nitrospirota bacterium]MDP2381657.1 sodium-dependent bicarbonate transport family permease [Nitrospirota bacterium]MDP3595403.1 sodium-dependent bicarbonate transport family permease [Nitrospirota bacterium]
MVDHTLLDAIGHNLTAPMPLFFALGILATLLRSELKVPDALYIGLTLYLLAAIGLHGGAEIREVGIMAIWMPIVACFLLGSLIPIGGYFILRYMGKFSIHDSAAIAGHYGSVSAVTFAVATQFLSSLQVRPEGYLSAFLAILEPTGVVVGILLARVALQIETRNHSEPDGATKARAGWIRPVLHEALTGTGSIILLGALVIGYISGPDGIAVTKPFFGDLFKGVLCLFMLEMGLVAGRRLAEVRAVGAFLIAFAIVMPIIDGTIGVLIGGFVGLSVGGATMLGVMAASASYIAAPAAMRISLPEANPSFYLTASLGITFPFNIAMGIPLYFWLAKLVFGS